MRTGRSGWSGGFSSAHDPRTASCLPTDEPQEKAASCRLTDYRKNIYYEYKVVKAVEITYDNKVECFSIFFLIDDVMTFLRVAFPVVDPLGGSQTLVVGAPVEETGVDVQ